MGTKQLASPCFIATCDGVDCGREFGDQGEGTIHYLSEKEMDYDSYDWIQVGDELYCEVCIEKWPECETCGGGGRVKKPDEEIVEGSNTWTHYRSCQACDGKGVTVPKELVNG